MTFADLPRIHSDFTEAMTRRPGTPPSRCPGRLIRVDPEHREIPWDSRPFLDSAQPREGDVGDVVMGYLARCEKCRNTLVPVRCPDGTWRLRNAVPDWREIELTQTPGDTEPEPAEAAATA